MIQNLQEVHRLGGEEGWGLALRKRRTSSSSVCMCVCERDIMMMEGGNVQKMSPLPRELTRVFGNYSKSSVLLKRNLKETSSFFREMRQSYSDVCSAGDLEPGETTTLSGSLTHAPPRRNNQFNDSWGLGKESPVSEAGEGTTLYNFYISVHPEHPECTRKWIKSSVIGNPLSVSSCALY